MAPLASKPVMFRTNRLNAGMRVAPPTINTCVMGARRLGRTCMTELWSTVTWERQEESMPNAHSVGNRTEHTDKSAHVLTACKKWSDYDADAISQHTYACCSPTSALCLGRAS